MKIDKCLPAGNIRVLEIRDHQVLLEEEERDSPCDWFYWKFRALFDEPGEWLFRFSRNWKVGTRGPAVSTDRGQSWHWLSDTAYGPTQEFSFRCRKPGEIWFCQALPYQQRDWELFAGGYASSPAFHPDSLCRSRKGREVELLRIREGEPPRAVLLTARHHCQETAASMVLEGLLRFALDPGAEGEGFRRHFTVFAVPFTDKDGVEEGDQGKGRAPRDHGRDYAGESVYPETAAIRRLIEKERPFLVMDLHSPWLRGPAHHEKPHFVENRVPRFQPGIRRLSRLLEEEAPPCAPFSHADLLRWGTAWNTPDNYNGKGLGGAGSNLTSACGDFPFVQLAATLEIPFANFGEKTMTRREFLLFGQAVGRALLRYGTGCRPDPGD